MVKDALTVSVPVVLRSLNGLPTITETPQIIHDWYYQSAEFIPVARYGRETKILDREIGCLAIIKGLTILPVLRIIIDERVLPGQSGKKGFVEGG